MWCLVVLCRGHTGRVLEGIEAILGGLDLRFNGDKTRAIDAKEQGFKFLGFPVEVKKNPKTGKLFPLIIASKEAMVEIKVLSCRRNLRFFKEGIIRRLDELVRGGVGYFYYGN